MEFFKKETNIDFVRWRNLAMAVSGAILLAGLISILAKGGLMLGIDFAGGTVVQVKFTEAHDISQIRSALAEKGFGAAIIQSQGEGTVAVRLKGGAGEQDIISDQIVAALQDRFGKDKVNLELVDMVGPQVGADMRRKGLLAIVYAILGILVYTAFRFQWLFGLGAILALIHDSFMIVALFSLLNKEFTLTIVAAILTIIGYSINDTIVIFDRVRENVRKSPKDDLLSVINRSINQTLSRTILTGGTVLLVVLSLYFFGGEVIHDFSLALLVGVIAGSYSTIYIAATVIAVGGRGRMAAGGALR